MSNPKKMSIAVLSVLSAAVAQTYAATSTTTFQVTATVLSTCVLAATPLVFGNYDPNAGTALDINSTITATCTIGTPYDIGLDAGTAAGATVTTRQMTNGANALNYALYSDSARTLNWGQTIGTDTVSGTGGVIPVIHTVYGRIPPGQNVPALLYTDTITATITF